MLKLFALIDNIWFDPTVKFPLKIGEKYVFRKLYYGRFEYRKALKEWELSNNNSTGRYPYVIEVKEEHERKDYQLISSSVHNLISLLRLIKYNRIYLAYIVCFENNRVTQSGSRDDPRPSSSLGNDEEISRKAIRELKSIVENIRQIISGKNERVLRAFHFWDSASCSGNFERKVVELFIALESLFTTGHEEVTFRLAARMAWFYADKDPDKRMELYQKIKKGYSIRSNIVHGRSFVETKDLPAIQELHGITREILLRIFTDKKLLSIFSEEDLEPYFNNLVMGAKIG